MYPIKRNDETETEKTYLIKAVNYFCLDVDIKKNSTLDNGNNNDNGDNKGDHNNNSTNNNNNNNNNNSNSG